jgi:Vacuolar sorting-associated protein 13, N-terminal
MWCSLGHWHGYFYEADGARETYGADTMMTLVLEPGDGEQELKGNGWSNKGRFTTTGSWSKDKNDVLQIEFKMTFQFSFWSAAILFNGYFNPERDALTLDYGCPTEFRRILPRYLTDYPSIKELSDNKPRALWKFAIAAVRNDIRRERWSWSYFSQRRNDRETFISLTLRDLYFGRPLDKEEIQRICTAAQRLTPADACFYASKINRIRKLTCWHL